MSNSKIKNIIFFILVAAVILLPTVFSQKESTAPIVSLPEKVYSTITLDTPYNSTLQIMKTDFSDHTCSISDYGAIPDDKTVNTKAFSDAIEDCAKGGGGHVIVPAGTWLTGPIQLLSNIDLHLEKDATVKFTTDPNDYLPTVFSRFEGIEYYNYSSLIRADNAENIAITGEGTLDGQGQAWWNFSSASIKNLYQMGENGVPVEKRNFGTVQDGLRPTFIEFVNCKIIRIDSVTIVKGPMWTIHPLYSHDITITNINIQTDPGPSTDGIAIDSSQNVLIDNSVFSTGDDAVVLKSGRDADGRRVNIPTENIVIRNCHVIEAHGAVAVGSEMSGGVKNVLAQNITVDNAQYGFRVKSNSNRGGNVENIWVEDFKINSLSQAAVQFNMFYERNMITGENFIPVFHNIHVDNLYCKNTADSINFFGIPGGYLKNINLKNIEIVKSRSGLQIENAEDISLDNINIRPKYSPVFDLLSPQNVTLSNSSCPAKTNNCFNITGASSKNIRLINNDFNQDKKRITIDNSIDQNEIQIENNIKPSAN